LLSLHFTIIAGLLALSSGVIFYIVSHLGTAPTRQQIEHFTFSAAAMGRQGALAWWQDYRLYSLILIVAASALVVAHW